MLENRTCFKRMVLRNGVVGSLFMFTSRVCGRGNVFVMSVCVCVSMCVFVCVCVCLCVWAITLEAVDIETSILV